MVSKYLTITEIAEQTDIPNSTCRRYLAAFEPFFSVKGGSRLKKYESDAVNVLKRIKQLYDEGLETHEIFDMLKNEFPLVVNSEEQRETSEQAPVIPTLATSEDIAEIKKSLEEQKQFNQALLQEMKQQHLYYEKKFDEVKYDREFIGSLRESMQKRKLESNEHENKTTKQLENIQHQLTEIQQKQNENKAVKELTEIVTALSDQLGQVQQSIKESAVASEEVVRNGKEKKLKKKKGLWAWLSGE